MMHRSGDVKYPPQIACNSLPKIPNPASSEAIIIPSAKHECEQKHPGLIVDGKSTNEMDPDLLDEPRMRRMLIILSCPADQRVIQRWSRVVCADTYVSATKNQNLFIPLCTDFSTVPLYGN